MRFVSFFGLALFLFTVAASSRGAEGTHATDAPTRARLAPRKGKPSLSELNDPCQALRASPASPTPYAISYQPRPANTIFPAIDSPVGAPAPSPVAATSASTSPIPSASPEPRQRGTLPSMICTAPGGFRVKYYGPETSLSRVQVYRNRQLVADYHCDESRESCERTLSEYWLKFSSSLLDYAKDVALGREKASAGGVQCHPIYAAAQASTR